LFKVLQSGIKWYLFISRADISCPSLWYQESYSSRKEPERLGWSTSISVGQFGGNSTCNGAQAVISWAWFLLTHLYIFKCIWLSTFLWW